MSRIFTEKEREMIRTDIAKAAGNWAVKESVAKVFGTGFAGVEPCEIEVLRDGRGAPYVNLLGKAERLAKEKGIDRIYVSISHTGDMVCAFAVGEGV